MTSKAFTVSDPTSTQTRLMRIPAYRTLPALRHPIRSLAEIGKRADGRLIQFNLGVFRPFLVSRPDHVQHVLRYNAANYLRDGMMWKPLRRLVGDGLASEGPNWEVSRKRLQPLFSGRNVAALTDLMADAISDAIADFDRRLVADEPVDVEAEITRIINRALVRAFFSDRIPPGKADALGNSIAAAMASLGARMLVPFFPESIPLPGDRTFLNTVRIVDDIIMPLVREPASATDSGCDVVSLLQRSYGLNGEKLDEKAVRDDVVSMFMAGTQSSVTALTWTLILLHDHPGVLRQMESEVVRVIGDERPDRRHLSDLRYMNMVIQEVLRLYPVGWMLPRTAAKRDVIDSVVIPAGATVLVSPYLTHRSPTLWPEPETFDPTRFTPDRVRGRHRFAYYPFGSGAHQCLGNALFLTEAQIILATLLRRYQMTLHRERPIEPKVSVSLIPRDPVQMTFARRADSGGGLAR